MGANAATETYKSEKINENQRQQKQKTIQLESISTPFTAFIR